MATIEIKNLGPVKHAKFELNKVNVFMGPQGSGKSTVAKIISYCTWIEKRRILDGFFRENFLGRLKEFHNLGDAYFPKNAYFKYVSEHCEIEFSKGEGKIIAKENTDFRNRKQIYIPAERNFVASIPNLGRYKETNNNILDFLYYWYDAKKAYNKDNILNIPELNVEFYNVEEEDKDVVVFDKNKDIILQHASSGVQSMLPLYLLVDYLTRIIYQKQKIQSPLERDRTLLQLRQKKKTDSSLNEFIDLAINVDKERREIEETLGLLETKITVSPEYIESKERYDHIKAEYQKYTEASDGQIHKFLERISDIYDYHYSQLIIEEPEQNLFPTTQRDLIYYMMRVLNESERDHRLTFTTHSPYILYALNNCMMGSLVYEKMSERDKAKLKCKAALIDPEKVSVYQIENGELRKIQGDDGLVGANYFDDKMKELMDDFYVMLNYYAK